MNSPNLTNTNACLPPCVEVPEMVVVTFPRGSGEATHKVFSSISPVLNAKMTLPNYTLHILDRGSGRSSIIGRHWMSLANIVVPWRAIPWVA